MPGVVMVLVCSRRRRKVLMARVDPTNDEAIGDTIGECNGESIEEAVGSVVVVVHLSSIG